MGTDTMGAAGEGADGCAKAAILRDARRHADRAHSRLVELSATGVAGPAPQGGRPVGEVHVGIASAQGVHSREYHLTGTRGDVRAAAAVVALADLVAELERRIEAVSA